jgi:hypothetical protein
MAGFVVTPTTDFSAINRVNDCGDDESINLSRERSSSQIEVPALDKATSRSVIA